MVEVPQLGGTQGVGCGHLRGVTVVRYPPLGSRRLERKEEAGGGREAFQGLLLETLDNGSFLIKNAYL